MERFYLQIHILTGNSTFSGADLKQIVTEKQKAFKESLSGQSPACTVLLKTEKSPADVRRIFERITESAVERFNIQTTNVTSPILMTFDDIIKLRNANIDKQIANFGRGRCGCFNKGHIPWNKRDKTLQLLSPCRAHSVPCARVMCCCSRTRSRAKSKWPRRANGPCVCVPCLQSVAERLHVRELRRL
jgi:hypothetical protein